MIEYIVLVVIISFILIIISYLVSRSTYLDNDKLSPYECGFAIYKDEKSKLEIRYFIICVLYLIFDLEISYLFPFIYNIADPIYPYLIFLFILLLGLIYEMTTNIVSKCCNS